MELLEILACPICKMGHLRHEQSSKIETLTCTKCSRAYKVLDGIPNMLPDEIGNDLSSKDTGWDVWDAKLKNFILWREKTWNGSTSADKLQSQAVNLKERFIDFTGFRNSSKRIIDIGCGVGGIREMLGTCRYYGVDPLLLENHDYDFNMVKGVGEHLPFADGYFDEAILNQVLDHCNSIDDLLEETVRVIGKNGSINVMQYVSELEGLFANTYNMLFKVYLSVKKVKPLDTKTRHFDVEGLLNLFRNRFEDVRFLKYSDSQLFIRATRWKKNQR